VVLSYDRICQWGRLADERDAPCAAPSTTVDHIVPKYLGGTDAYANLRGLCARHQQIKAGREGAAARRSSMTRRAIRARPADNRGGGG
jgi:5-methylcytosine-specific restriction endonuclease McrA